MIASNLVGRLAEPERGVAANAYRGATVIAALGSSTVERGSGMSGANYMRYAWGPATWATTLSGGRLYMPFSANFGVSGQVASLMLPRVQRVIDHRPKPGFCILPIGTNDALNAISAETFEANARLIVSRLSDGGVCPVLVVPHPVLGQAAVAQSRLARNAEILRRIAAVRNDVILVDCLDELMDPAGAAYEPHADVMADSLHLSPKGAFIVGRAIANALASAGVAPKSPLIRSAADAYDATSNPYGSLTPNPMMAGTGGSVTSGTVSGDVPANWLAANFLGGGTAALAAVTAGGKAWCEATIGGTYGGGEGQLSLFVDASAANVAVGDRLQATVEVDCDSLSNFGSVALCITTTQGGQTVEAWDGWPMDGAGPDQNWSGVLRTPDLPITAAASAVRMRIRVYVRRGIPSGAIAGKFRFRAATIRKR